MNNLLTARPAPKFLVTEVPTIEWIDNHADKDKIWALVTCIRDESSKEGYDNGWVDGYNDFSESRW